LQNLSHSNTAVPNVVSGVNANQLQSIGFGFNNSTANATLHAQLAPGIRVQLTSYLSARHHNETWVKDGYIQIDQSPIDFVPLKMLFEIATVRVGHMEINYGDAHFRRSDNGNAVYNPFVGNYIMDAFTTEIGGEVYLKLNGLIAMGAVTAGELRGTVVTPEQRGPSLIGKLGVDRQLNKELRVRLTGSVYKANQAMSNTLYGGDRAGSRYYWVMENTTATESANYTSGAINPGFRNKVTAFQMNPFEKYRGLEVFGVLERAEGKASAELTERVWKQYAVDTVYRFMPDESLFVGVRYNKATGELAGITGDAGANRWQFGGGWFITPNILAKAEYVNQKYFGYPTMNIKNGGRIVQGDALDPKSVGSAIVARDAVIYVLGAGNVRHTTLFSESTSILLAAMELDSVRRLICVTGVGAGETKGHGGFLYDRILYPLFTKGIYEDKDRQEALIRQSRTEWTIVRPAAFRKQKPPGSLRVVTRVNGVILRRISRREVAVFLIDELEQNRYVRQTVFIGHE
jgi:putative NADH-flavin reductase